MPRLVPKPHMIKSIRNRNWKLAGAIEELVDNSLGHGRARNVRIHIDNAKGIAVIDDGIGVDDINRMFRLGDASSYESRSEIGQYGVGAKNATIFLGDLVTVSTVRDGIRHTKTVDWDWVESQGEWPEEYAGTGKPTKETGTKVVVTRLSRYFKLSTSEGLAKELGQTFSPALQKGVKISVSHCLANGKDQELTVEPFTPHDLTNITEISGEIETKHGILKWSGRAGLSASLKDEFNWVHIAFGHRVIERVRDPFKGKSAPTLYADIQLDESSPWKYQLSEHKDKIVRYRDELFDSIFESIRKLLELSEGQAQDLALNVMIAPIEAALNKKMKGAGIFRIDEDEEPEEGGHGDGLGKRRKKRGKHLRTPTDDGVPAKEPPRPSGVRIEYCKAEAMDGRAFGWNISGKLMTIQVDRDRLAKVLKWPPGVREEHTMHLVISFLSHAIEIEFYGTDNLHHAVTPKLYKQIEEWASIKRTIAPYVYTALMESAL